MKIDRIEVWGVAVPLIGEYKNAYRSKTVQKSALVRITESGGAIGLGNIDPSPGYSRESIEDSLRVLETRLAPLVVGMDPANIHRVLQKIEPAAEGYFDAKAAIEMACVDLTARVCGVPVHTYLGGAVKDTLLFNAWIGILPPDEAAAETVAWQRRGFRSAKIKVGGNIEADRDRVKAVREAVGPDFKLRIDANAGYDADTSIRLARMVAPYGLQLFEQPVPEDDIAGMAHVRREAAGIPIMADESVLDHASLIRIIEARAADLVKVKVMKQGGFINTRRMIAT
ncbi:MAG: enolase C-terminal domain-like protein, partial [Pseudomonadota bacterium]